jgi:outer membrane biogenesis lipoprotein LolB
MQHTRLLFVAAALLTACAAPTEPRPTPSKAPQPAAADLYPDDTCLSGYSVGHGICAP